MSGIVHREIVVPNDTKYLADIRRTVSGVLDNSGFLPADAHRVTLAVDEAVTNIMQHAYENDLEGNLEIELVLEMDQTKVEVVIRDSGKSFDPGKVDVPDVEKHVRAGKKHGLGLFLIRQIMDEVTYSYKEGVRNELRMVKYKHIGGTKAAGNRSE